jgi:tetratricopeptide (TPR) repeat protein
MQSDRAKANLEVKLALQDNPSDAKAHFLLASLFAEQGNYDLAIVGFQRACALDPTNPEALYNLGTLLLWRNEPIAASKLLESAILIQPDDVPYYNNLGKAYFVVGLPELAVATYEEALLRDPWNVTALQNLAVLADGAGLKDTAADYRKRLQGAQASGHGAPPAPNTSEPIILLPTWPLAAKTVNQPPPGPPPAPKPQPPPDPEVEILRAYLRDLPHVKVERLGDKLALVGWTTGPTEKDLLARILAARKDALDLTTDDVGDPKRMIEMDAVLLTILKVDTTSVGFNFLQLITTNLSTFTSRNNPSNNANGLIPPGSTPTGGAVTGAISAVTSSGWLFFASINYNVDIANAQYDQVALLARPHLTALSGGNATFLAGGDLYYEIAGNVGGNLEKVQFGTTLTVTPTLLLTPAEDGSPQVHITVQTGRKSPTPLPITPTGNNGPSSAFDDVNITSETIIPIDRTLILSGLSQREATTTRTGVPGLMYIPLLKYFFSNKTTTIADAAIVILLTPRDPAYWGEKNQKEYDAFVLERRAFLQARQGTPQDWQHFKERYPNWDQIPPNRFSSNSFLIKTSELYRKVAGVDLTPDQLDADVDLLGPPRKSK